MKNVGYIAIGLIAGCLIGRLSVKPEVHTEVVTEYRPILSSITTPSSISEQVGSRFERVKFVFVREDNFPIIDKVSDTATMVKHIDQPLEIADSAIVELPIRDYTFTDDSTYTITARGAYVESLPDVQFWPKRTTTTTQTSRQPRIIHGVQAGGGLAYTSHGLLPCIYLGYGVTIRF